MADYEEDIYAEQVDYEDYDEPAEEQHQEQHQAEEQGSSPARPAHDDDDGEAALGGLAEEGDTRVHVRSSLTCHHKRPGLPCSL